METSDLPEPGHLSSLFSPLRIGCLRLKNRIVMTSVVTGNQSGEVPGEALKRYYATRARGGAAVVMVENAMIAPGNGGMSLGLYHDRFIEPFKSLVAGIHDHGALAGIQLNHLGRQWPIKSEQVQLVAPSALPWSPRAPVPRELTVSEIGGLEEMFGDAAARAVAAGFDIIEIHAAHGYLMSEFLSPASNQRRDQFGGDLKGRARFAEETVRSARQRIGNRAVLSCRINGADNIPGGLTIEEASQIARLLVAAGVDLLSVSAGAFGSTPTIVAPVYAPRDGNVQFAAAVKRVVSVPVITAGRIRDPHSAEQILRDGKADLIGLARPLIADPELPNKWSRGEFDEVNPCISCNNCIETSAPGPTTCTVNPLMGRDNDKLPAPAARKKKVFIAGGGLAGLEAAAVAASRGHQVTLYERGSAPGGQWLLASAGSAKREFLEAVDYRVKKMDKLGVTLKTDEALSPETVKKEKPDVVVVATGAAPVKPSLHCGTLTAIGAWDVLANRLQTGNKVLVIGGGSVGLETADFLVEQGKSVTVVEMTAHLGSNMFPSVRWHLMPRLAQGKVQILKSTRIECVNVDGVVVTHDAQREVLKGFDTIVFATGSRWDNSLAEAIRGLAPEVYTIGDAVSPRNGLWAIREGYEVGARI